MPLKEAQRVRRRRRPSQNIVDVGSFFPQRQSTYQSKKKEKKNNGRIKRESFIKGNHRQNGRTYCTGENRCGGPVKKDHSLGNIRHREGGKKSELRSAERAGGQRHPLEGEYANAEGRDRHQKQNSTTQEKDSKENSLIRP